jgi:hypothetical protein
LEHNTGKHPQLGALVAVLETAVREFWDAEDAYIETTIKTVGLVAGNAAAATLRRTMGPGLRHFRVQDLGADHSMFNTKADFRAVLDAITRFPMPASACLSAGESVLTAWVAAEAGLKGVGLP